MPSRHWTPSPPTCGGRGIVAPARCSARSIPRCGRTPAMIRGSCSPVRAQTVSTSWRWTTRFVLQVKQAADDLERALTGPSWYEETGPDIDGVIAYFSPEFGIAEAVPQYSGGLGILAGDHLKSCVRPRCTAGRDRSLLPPRLLPSVAVGRRLATGALQRPRSVRDVDEPLRGREGRGRSGRRDRCGPGSGMHRSGERRSTCSTATSMRTPTTCG